MSTNYPRQIIVALLFALGFVPSAMAQAWPEPPPGMEFDSCRVSSRATTQQRGIFQVPVRGNAGMWWNCTLRAIELPEAQTPPERLNAWSVAEVGVELDKAVMLQHGFVLDVTTENAELKRKAETEAFRADFAETLVSARDAEISELKRELSEAEKARDAAEKGSSEFRAQAERATRIAKQLAAKLREQNPTTPTP